MYFSLLTFLFVLHFVALTFALRCSVCHQSLVFNSSETINTARPECRVTYSDSQMCMSVLSIDYESKTANVTFNHLHEQEIIFTNGHMISTNSIKIWFSKDVVFHDVQAFCFNSTICAEDMNKIYKRMKNFNDVELRTKLQERLYSAQLNSPDLTCANNQGQTIQCQNGFCHLVCRGPTSVDRICVSQGQGTNPSGIVIKTTTNPALYTERSYIYACNKPMCNGVEIEASVQQLLEQYELMPSPQTIVTITDSPVTSKSTSIGTASRPVMATNSTLPAKSSTRSNSGRRNTTTLTTTTEKSKANRMMTFQWIASLLIIVILYL
ncbi:unnamed protein product [Adineta ricciae]|uniref:Uncharacterized protein n=1 Tax=Adineta ricciae TaxID=249248 RepID=A0A814XRA6_ADIRI|nr:unnamed protein product [Adineta ricciae]CAF1295521.1 unnamed protein product [Adineta ricciae]